MPIQFNKVNRRPSTSEQWNQALSSGSNFIENQGKMQQLNQYGESIGISNLASLPPEMQQVAVQKTLDQRNQMAKSGMENKFNQKQYDTIKNRFGEEEADLYAASTEGGKTKLIEKNIDKELREKSSEGLTPGERTKREESRYSINLPLYQESHKKLLGYETEKDHLDILEELSPQIQAIERLNMNPMTGELIIPALASPEAQRFVKTINDFTIQAKDSYGSRVTNFDLANFMKRLPTLANSEEGRRQIIKQMKTINAINSIRERTIQNIIDQNGGLRNIDYDQAERLADKESKSKIDELKKQFRQSEDVLNSENKKELSEFKKNVPKDQVAVRMSDGTIGYLPKENVKKMLDAKAGEVL